MDGRELYEALSSPSELFEWDTDGRFWYSSSNVSLESATHFSIPYTEGSDLVCVANRIALVEMYNAKRRDAVVENLGYVLVLPLKEPIPQELCEAVLSLEDYPILDEELLAEMELNQTQENWESYGRDEFVDELFRKSDRERDDFKELSDELLDEFWQDLCSRRGLWPEQEDESTIFYFNEVLAGVTEEEIEDLFS